MLLLGDRKHGLLDHMWGEQMRRRLSSITKGASIRQDLPLHGTGKSAVPEPTSSSWSGRLSMSTEG